MRREVVTGCTVCRYEQFESSPETIEQELRPAICGHQQTDLRRIIVLIKALCIFVDFFYHFVIARRAVSFLESYIVVVALLLQTNHFLVNELENATIITITKWVTSNMVSNLVIQKSLLCLF